MKRLGRRPAAHEIRAHCAELIRQQSAAGNSSQMMKILIRITIKSSPYMQNVAHLIGNYKNTVRQYVGAEMPEVADRVSICNQKELPLPLIISCKKYLDKAKRVARELELHYFNIKPIIVIGGLDSGFESFNDGILKLPVSDDYEGLPYKMLEVFTLFDALGARCGVIKIDDDVTINKDLPPNLDEVRSAFKFADYMGNVMGYPHFDRTWHFGKCNSSVSSIYGKAFVAPYANGPLYFLSKTALSKLTSHYLKYPGCLEGELYEDKAVGDILHSYGINAEHNPLQYTLQIDTDAPDRLASISA
ncbi:hypothetical protein [Methylobacterium sp. E-066]|uniref:hypothetical protein n=1 Tax=Methylobacterium sp. E-066 TaxID=2836584 RepID=UPI001FBBDA97|nr:hypothetical protein [Methylobacterium sp. E-066]MCJ2140558.1 hypothetical protein [Methylobacterium sp. E-066]